jgi:hypothetical protein
MSPERLRVVILKPSKYGQNGYVERFRRGFMPNSTIPYLRSMTPEHVDGIPIEIHCIDEYVRTNLDYFHLLRKADCPTLLALVGVQSHQFQRSLDLAAYARSNGVENCVIGGPHPMTCDTVMLQNRGISFSLAEAEMVWLHILRDALSGELRPVYGQDQRWDQHLESPVVIPPSKRDLRRYIVPMLGLYPARGCPFTCNFCSVIKIAGRQIRSQSIETTVQSLRAAKAAGVRMVMFTSDNFNKYADGRELLECMIEEKIGLPFFVQCDTQIAKQEDFISLLARAGCFQIFVGVESFSRKVLLAARKTQNHPTLYGDIAMLCRRYGISSHFSNIIGFPEDTEANIREHLDVLKGLDPDIASFYILVPLPGTQQYDEFLADGRIFETNLDRFDAQSVTWRHDHLSPPILEDWLFRCYQEFNSPSHIARTTRDSLAPGRVWSNLLPSLGLALFTRFAARRRTHPMSGGIGRVRADSVDDYLPLRRRYFDVDLVPLPASLALSAADAEMNRNVKIAF